VTALAATAVDAPTEHPTSRLDRLTLMGYASPVVLYLVPMTLRLAFGACSLRFFATDFALTMVMIAALFFALDRAYRHSHAHRHSVVETVVVAVVVCAATMSALNAGKFALRDAFPVVLPIDPGEPPGVAFALASGVSDALPVLVVWGGLFLLPRVLLENERHRAESRAARRDAELLRLRAHLEPHFVLNTLTTIAGRVADEPAEARRLIGLLGDLFREATSDRDEESHGLAAEVDWLQRYAAVHEARHGKMVRFAWSIDASAERFVVPRLILQPLVENAVLHGVMRKRGGGTVRVGAFAEGADLVCYVEDDGPGFDRATRPGASGLTIVRRRLALLPRPASLDVARSGAHTRVTMRLGGAG
jgi:Histidine kinase